MKTPVIIPAFNESERIEATLRRLPQSLVEPIVALNGVDDGTSDIVANFGVRLLRTQEQGKMIAIQQVLYELGERALDPLIILDADTKPLFPANWHNTMLGLLNSHDKPVGIGGPIIYSESPSLETFLRTGYRAVRAVKNRKSTDIHTAIQFGPNMAFRFQNPKTLAAIMGLANFWPGEDRAMANAIVDNDGVYLQPIDPRLTTLTPPSISAISLQDRLHFGAEMSWNIVEKRYIERGAPNSEPYRN